MGKVVNLRPILRRRQSVSCILRPWGTASRGGGSGQVALRKTICSPPNLSPINLPPVSGAEERILASSLMRLVSHPSYDHGGAAIIVGFVMILYLRWPFSVISPRGSRDRRMAEPGGLRARPTGRLNALDL